jgi:hypothetical protein
MAARRVPSLGLLLLLSALAAVPLSSDPASENPARLAPASQTPPRQRVQATARRGLALGMATGGGVALTESYWFPLKAQGFWEAGALVEFPLFGLLALGLSLAYRYTAASDLAGGFLYRGHGGMSPGLYLTVKSLPAPDPARIDLQGGAATGATASLDRYSLTELYFFYISIFFEPFLEFHFPRLGPNTFSLGAPLRLDFRRDLDTSFAFGLGLSWRFYPGARKAKK